MTEKTQTKGQSISGLFTMLLFLVFVLCALFSVLMGSQVYENITKRSDENFSGTTALSYIANKIRQGDRQDGVDIIEVDGTSVLQLKQKIGEETYHTWIYWKDGSIRELFTDENSGLGLEDGLEILECSGLSMEKKGRSIILQTQGEGAASLKLSLRRGGKDANEQKYRVWFWTIFDGNGNSCRLFYALCGSLPFGFRESRQDQ